MFENNEFFFFKKKKQILKVEAHGLWRSHARPYRSGPRRLTMWLRNRVEVSSSTTTPLDTHPIDESNITRFRRTAFRESCLGIISQRSTYPQQWPHGWLHKGTQTLANKNFFIIVNVLNTKYHTFVIWKIKNVNIFPGNFFFFIFRWNIFVVEDCYIIHN